MSKKGSRGSGFKGSSEVLKLQIERSASTLGPLAAIRGGMMEIKQFLERLGSATPTPGGGSASALAGAISASLIAMVAGLSLKKGKRKRKGMEEIRKEALAIQRRLFRAIDEDAKSFDAVMEAFRLPKETEIAHLHRSEMIQKAYQKATFVPRLTCQHSIQLLEYSKILLLKGNPNAVSDAGVAAFLADAAFTGGLLNVSLNLGSVTEKTFQKKMYALVERLAKRRNHLMGSVLKTLQEKRGQSSNS